MGTRTCPENWSPKDSTREWARTNAPDVDFWKALTEMRLYEFKRPYGDWDRVAMNWLRKAQEKAAESKPEPLRNTFVEPPKLDKFDRNANATFLYAVRKANGLPKHLIDPMLKRAKQLKHDFRLLEKEGEPVDHFPKTLLAEFRRIYAER